MKSSRPSLTTDVKLCCRSLHESMGCDKESFTLVWRDTSSCPGPYPTAACPKFHVGCRPGRELFTLPICCHQCPWSHGLQPKKFYHTLSVTVTPAPVGSLPNGRLFRVSRRLGRELFTFPSYFKMLKLLLEPVIVSLFI